MFEYLINLVGSYKYLIYLLLIAVMIAIIIIYIKKYMILQDEKIDSNNEMLEIRAEMSKVMEDSRHLKSKINELNTQLKYGTISTSSKLPFTMDCMENTPFYNILGSQLFSNIINNSDDELSPTSNRRDNVTLTKNNSMIEELSSTDDESSVTEASLTGKKQGVDSDSDNGDDDNINYKNAQLSEESSLKTKDFLLSDKNNNEVYSKLTDLKQNKIIDIEDFDENKLDDKIVKNRISLKKKVID